MRQDLGFLGYLDHLGSRFRRVLPDAAFSSTAEATEVCAAPRPLQHAARVYGLDPLEVDLLALALGSHVDRGWAAWWRAETGSGLPELGLALAGLGISDCQPAHLDRILAGAFQEFGLLDVVGDGSVQHRRLSLRTELIGRLAGAESVRPLGPLHPPETNLLASFALPDPIRAQTLAGVSGLAEGDLVILRGPPGSGRTGLARAMAAEAGLPVIEVDAEQLKTQLPQVRRDALWWSAAVLVHGTGVPIPDSVVRGLHTPVLWICGEDDRLPIEVGAYRGTTQIRLPSPSRTHRETMWADALGTGDERPRELAARFRYGPGQIAEIVRRAGRDAAPDAIERRAKEVQLARFGGLAQQISGHRSWDDLVVSAHVRQELRLATAWAHHGRKVFEDWGLGRSNPGALGLTALLHGPPGTGKTLAAHVLANALGLELYRVDLSQVLDKFIGETEKKLGRLFDEALHANILLLFDEADALFGRRTEVKSAHDRYANVETGYLLQRIDEHPGPVVLATNLVGNLDPAFLRRLHIVAEFALPDAEALERIWRLHLPPTEGELDLALLSTAYPISGAEVRSTCVVAALIAAERDETPGMKHLVLALAREMRKAGRLVESQRFGPWAHLFRPDGPIRPEGASG